MPQKPDWYPTKALQNYLASSSSLLANTEDGYWVEDPAGRIVHANRPVLGLLGYASAGDLLGMHWSMTVSPNNHHAVELRNRYIPAPYDTLLIARNGHELPVSMTATPVFEDEQFVCILTRVVRTAKGLENRADDQVQWQANSQDAVIDFDDQFLITDWNRGAEQMYGWKAREAVGRPVQEIIRLDFLNVTAIQGGRPAAGSQLIYARGVNARKDGLLVQVEAQMVLVRNRFGRIIHYTAILRELPGRP